jgi:hypothetical protein
MARGSKAPTPSLGQTGKSEKDAQSGSTPRLQAARSQRHVPRSDAAAVAPLGRAAAINTPPPPASVLALLFSSSVSDLSSTSIQLSLPDRCSISISSLRCLPQSWFVAPAPLSAFLTRPQANVSNYTNVGFLWPADANANPSSWPSTWPSTRRAASWPSTSGSTLPAACAPRAG